MLPEAGKLAIRITRRDGALDVKIAPPASLPMSTLLAGKAPEEAARLVPLIFNICAAAQEGAVRSALGLPIGEDLLDRMTAETLREHVVKLCMIWPTALGQAAGREALGLAARWPLDDAARVGLRMAIFGGDHELPTTLGALSAWADAGETAPARAFARVLGDWDPGWGLANLPLLDVTAPVDWSSATQGGPVENAPACRLTSNALLADLVQVLGHGPVWRMAARLVEVDEILTGTRTPIPTNGSAQAARGLMMVDATADDTGVTKFARLSPTEFALAPEGLLQTALETLPLIPQAELRVLAQMVVETVDPCIATELEVRDA